MASAEKTRRHLAELDAKAVAAEKKEKRRRTYMARLAKKEAAIAAQKVALVQRTEAVEAAEAALAENTRAHVAREHELAQREQRQEEQAEEARIKSADLDARAGEISLEKEQVATARSELVTEAEEVRAQRIELDAGLAAIDHVVAAVEDANGDSIVKGRKVTAFTNSEEEAVGLVEAVPFLLETKLRELGAKFDGVDNWQPHAVADGRLVTGQNPASSEDAAKKVLALL